MRAFFSFLLAVATLHAADYYPPAGRRPPSWEANVYTGIIGGIPTILKTDLINLTQAPYNADNTGATDCQPAWQAAHDAWQAGGTGKMGIYMPAGTYLFLSGMSLDQQDGSDHDFYMVGDVDGNGTPTSLIVLGDATHVAYTNVGDAYADDVALTISAGLTKGSDTLTVNSTSGVSVGKILRITINDDPTIPIVSTYNYPNTREQWTNVTEVTDATHLKIFPTIYRDISTYGASAHTAQRHTNNIGFRDLAYRNDGGFQSAFKMDSCSGVWLNNVKITKATSYFMYITDCVNIEVTGCDFRAIGLAGPGHSGIQISSSSALLVENTIVSGVQPGIEFYGRVAGSVVAYCIVDGTVIGIDPNHNATNFNDLMEGNITPDIQCDGYYGTTHDDTVYRNYVTGWSQYAAGIDKVPTSPVILNRFTRNYNVVANFLNGPTSCGNPNLGNGAHTGTSQYSAGTYWLDWLHASNRPMNWTGTLTTRTDSTHGVITLDTGQGTSFVAHRTASLQGLAGTQTINFFDSGTVTGDVVSGVATRGGAPLPSLNASMTIWPSPDGFQELDLDTNPDWKTTSPGTTISIGNYYADAPDHENVVTGSPGTPAWESLGSYTLADSYFRTSRPAYFTGGYSWPPFTPGGAAPTYNATPAGARFINSPPTGGSTMTINGTLKVNGTIKLP